MGILRKMFYTDYICQMKIINNMNENIDLTKILKDCPKGTKFYTTAWGEVSFDSISDLETYVITIYTYCGYRFLTKDGRYVNREEAECIIFPSKDQRDWNKFVAPWYKKERFDPKELKPFDKVLVRDDVSGDCWRCSLYSHTRKKEESTLYRYATMDNSYTFCIPYNDDTKHLVGKTDEAPEYYRYWED